MFRNELLCICLSPGSRGCDFSSASGGEGGSIHCSCPHGGSSDAGERAADRPGFLSGHGEKEV